MASAAPHVKLLRQLATAKDDYVSGALDIAWDGGNATIFVVFGQPSHAQLSADGYTASGQDAVESLPHILPRSFEVSGWRRVMPPEETLACSIDELAAPFVELAGAPEPEAIDPDAVENWLGDLDDSPELGFGADDFPPLPGGTPSHGPASPLEVRLAELLPQLTSSLVTLTGTRLRAAGVVVSGELIDAVWVDGEDHACGDTAVIALLGARQGEMSVFPLRSAAIAEALPMLWRLPRAPAIDSAWVDPASLTAALQSDSHDRAVVVEAPLRGAALFREGALICAYSEQSPSAEPNSAVLQRLLGQSSGRVHLLQRPGTPSTTRQAAADAPAALSASGSGSDEVQPAPESFAPSPIGVDFAEVKRELAQISISWLGEPDAAAILRLITSTPPSIDDIVAMIEAVRSMHVAGQDPATLQALARELHEHAAERLCGA